MKKILIFSVLVILLIVGVFAASSVAGSDVGEEVSDFVDGFVSKRGIAPENINEIKQVDFNALPKEINIENVEDTNLAIYQVDYSENNQDKKVFVIAYSVEELKAQGDLIVASSKRNFLDFGHSGVMGNSGFLETSAGVETSVAKGYIMPRDGSITAISTNLEVIQSNQGQIEIIVLKNGQPISFGNTLSTESLGVKKDYDVQARDIVDFAAGDVLSVFAQKTGSVSWQDVITIVEITTVN
ncbi:MAG: hypothetical protein ABH840_01460 [Nanoarchaeota archaeon]